ncbi:MAG TPA: right-handed parallel beta-helix repeat-containing protein [Candidatus Saccharimonadales bacterium]|nr:right-handed parallel beta-helix repeat-containing protein [Candidatus Saccharimonadales bacterium]
MVKKHLTKIKSPSFAPTWARISEYSGRRFTTMVMAALVVSALGLHFIFTSHAATFVSAPEAESGALAGKQCVNSDTTASSGASVKFGTTGCTVSSYPATPADTGAQICGNNTVLGGGPTAAPAGAVTVPAGDNSSVFQYALPASTTYWFAPGTHTLGTDQYGQIQPGNNDTFVGAPGAIISGQSMNKYAFTGQATGVTIKYLTIQLFGIGETTTAPTADDQDEGIVNHDSGVGWTMQYNTMQYNGGGAMFLGSNNVGSFNCLTQNAQYGFQVIGNFNGAHADNVKLDHNEISYNDTYDFEAKSGGNCGCTGGGKFWAASNVTITNNYVHDNHSMGLWADTNNYGFDVEHNYISGNFGTGFFYEISYNAIVKNNNFVHNAIGTGKPNPGFPVSAVYISESGGDARVPGISSGSLTITGNNFLNNWGGVVAYENPNRYCSSSANTSTGYCTLVNPGVANLTTCANASLLATKPYIDDCRWKSQNITVSGNSFTMNPTAVDATCTQDNGCGFNGIISGYGVYPPYLNNFVPNNIIWNQKDLFSGNTYSGPWGFQAWAQNNKLTWAQWTGAISSGDKCLGSGEVQSGQCFGPFGQDAGSTMH